MANTVFRIQKNHRVSYPRTVMFLEVDTYYREEGGFDWHYLTGAEIRTHHYDKEGTLCKTTSLSPSTTADTWRAIESQSKSCGSLLVVGSHITFAAFSADLPQQMSTNGWTSSTLHSTTDVCLMSAQRKKNTIRFCNITNWVSMPEELPDQAMERIELVAKAFDDYVRFLVAHDMGNFKYTIAAQAMTCYRHRFMTEEILHYDKPEFNQLCRAGYFGGRIEAGRIGRLPAGQYTRLDINSLYSSVMQAYRYPTRFIQWLRNCNLDNIRERAEKCGVIAQVVVSTDRPRYPLRRNGRTIFPTGRFRTWMCTGSFQAAADSGEIEAVEQCLLFQVGDILSGFVDYFYPLKSEYHAAEMAIWRNTVKRLLNSLYGKFAERHDLTLWEGEAPETDLYSKTCLLPAELVPWAAEKFNWNHVAEKHTGKLYVAATEHACLGRKWYTAGGKEAEHSAPAISAHVTDYGRLALWEYIEKLGYENLIYCDTDSLIFETKHLPKLEEYIDEQRLGALRPMGEATSVEIRGAKDYTFGNEDIIAGKPASAVWQNHRLYQCRYFPDPHRLLQPRAVAGAPIGSVTRAVAQQYNKGDVLGDGRVVPFFLEDGR